jgi:hypothetical protein
MANLLKKKHSTYTVYYLVPTIMVHDNNGYQEISMDLRKKEISYSLKDLFMNEFGDALTSITEEKINEFIEKNS